MADDRLTAELAAIRERSRWRSSEREIAAPGANALRSAKDVPRLLAAVEAALAAHEPRTVTTTSLCAAHGYLPDLKFGWAREQVISCLDCAVTEKLTCVTCRHLCPDDDTWPCATIQAITRALLGEDKPDD